MFRFMSLSRRRLLVFGFLPLVAACSSVVPPAPGPNAGLAPPRLTQAGILAAINGARAANGKPPLRYNMQLEAAARTQANLMASKDQLSHDLGQNLHTRVVNAGYDGASGENVAGGYRTLDQTIVGWLNSAGHRATLLSTRFEEFGLAVATVAPGRKSRYGTYWSFIAGGPRSAWLTAEN
jgi:uncharacterized protein YkwD